MEITCSLTVCTAGCYLCAGQIQCRTSVQGTGHSHDSRQLHHLQPSFHPIHPPPIGWQVTIFAVDIYPTYNSICCGVVVCSGTSCWLNKFKLNTLQLTEWQSFPLQIITISYGDNLENLSYSLWSGRGRTHECSPSSFTSLKERKRKGCTPKPDQCYISWAWFPLHFNSV